MAIQNWHIQHINDTFSTLNGNMEAWQWANITDITGKPIVSRDSSGNMTVHAGQYTTLNAGATKTYLDADFKDLTARNDLFTAGYLKLLTSTDDYLRFQDNDIQIAADGVVTQKWINTLVSINPDAGNVDFKALKQTSGTAFHVDVSGGVIAINQDASGSYKLQITAVNYISAIISTYNLTSETPSGTDAFMVHYRNVTGVANREIWSYTFDGYDDADTTVEYCRIMACIKDPSAGAEYGRLRFWTKQNGSDVSSLIVDDDVYSGASGWIDWSSSASPVGWSSLTTEIVYYKKIGKLILVKFILIGTGSGNNCSFTLPERNVSDSISDGHAITVRNPTNLSATPGQAYIFTFATSVNLYTDWAQTNWAASVGAQRQASGYFWYQAA